MLLALFSEVYSLYNSTISVYQLCLNYLGIPNILKFGSFNQEIKTWNGYNFGKLWCNSNSFDWGSFRLSILLHAQTNT